MKPRLFFVIPVPFCFVTKTKDPRLRNVLLLKLEQQIASRSSFCREIERR